MTIPYILKEAFFTDQLRAIKAAIPVTRNSEEKARYATKAIRDMLGNIEVDRSRPRWINIPKPHDNPLPTLVHEFGHFIDYETRTRPSHAISEELAANRMGARYLLHTGSPISEVKDFIRGQKHNIGSYVASTNADLINDMMGRIKYNIPQELAGKLQNVGGLTADNPRAQEVVAEIAQHIAKEHNINMNVVSPFTQIKSPIDISVLGAGAKNYKLDERAAFAKVMDALKIKKKLRVPKIIYL